MTILLTPARSLGLRPELTDRLRADVWDYGNNRIWLPKARAKRKKLLGAKDEEEDEKTVEAATIPSVKLWPFALQETTAGDAIATSPDFLGPALIDTLFLLWDDDNTAPRPTVQVFYGTSQPASANNDPSTIGQLGTGLFETTTMQQEVAATFAGPIAHLPKSTLGQAIGMHTYPLRKPIDLTKFQLSVRIGTAGVGSHMLQGYLRVVESLTAEQIIALL